MIVLGFFCDFIVRSFFLVEVQQNHTLQALGQEDTLFSIVICYRGLLGAFWRKGCRITCMFTFSCIDFSKLTME